MDPDGMTTEPASETLRETVDALCVRLRRITAATTSLDHMAADIRRDLPPGDLAPLLSQLKRDLAMATHDVELTQARVRQAIDEHTPTG